MQNSSQQNLTQTFDEVFHSVKGTFATSPATTKTYDAMCHAIVTRMAARGFEVTCAAIPDVGGEGVVFKVFAVASIRNTKIKGTISL